MRFIFRFFLIGAVAFVFSCDNVDTPPIPTVKAPAFTPAGGSYPDTLTVDITSETDDAEIRYTTDGSTPSKTLGILYAGPVTINHTCTLTAIAYKEGSTDSETVAADFTISGTVETPVLSLAEGTFNGPQSVTITCATPGSSIRYTIDGSEPTRTNGAAYAAPITISKTTTLKAIAYKTSWHPSRDSQVASAVYTLQAADPVISVDSGFYTLAQSIQITCATPNTSIFYTTDGSAPTMAAGKRYTGTLVLSQSCTLTAVAFRSEYAQSNPVSETYTITGRVATPVFSVAEGTYQNNRNVTITCATPGSVIRYTLDDSDPARTNGILYTGPVGIAASATLKAIAYVADWQGSADSAIKSAAYTLTVANPAMSVDTGYYTNAQSVTISSATTGASIYYSIDGNPPVIAPANLYAGAFNVAATTTVKAIAVKTGYTDSQTITEVYDITGPVATPAFSVAEGTHNNNLSVEITCTTPGRIIKYTTNGTDPSRGSGQTYSGPIAVSTTTEIRTMAYVTSWQTSADTPVQSATYTMQTAAPVFSLAEGGYLDEQDVTISCATTGATIYYSTDGNPPALIPANLYTGTIRITHTCTLSAIAIRAGYADSDMTDAVYTLTLPVATPVFSVDTGTYGNNQVVTITCPTFGNVMKYILYTTGDPVLTRDSVTDVNYTVVTCASPTSVSITGSAKLKAIAYVPAQDPTFDSTVKSAVYTLKAATPVLSPTRVTNPADTNYYRDAQTITISCDTTDAFVYYSTDGNAPVIAPANLYTAGTTVISVTTQKTIKAIAVKADYTDSDIATRIYSITGSVPAPAFNHPAGTYYNDLNLDVTCTTTGRVIMYSTNVAITPSRTTGTAHFSSDPLLFDLSGSITIKAMTYVSAWEPISDSAVQTMVYTLQAATPQLSVAQGMYTDNQTVTITTDTIGATIRYTTDPAQTPSPTFGTIYSAPVAINNTCTLKAIAYKNSYSNSDLATAAYTITGPVAEPVFTPVGGTKNNDVSLNITCPTADSYIVYTTDGTDPNPYLPAPGGNGTTMPKDAQVDLTISSDTIVKAMAFVPEWNNDSDTAVVTHSYVMKTGNPTFQVIPPTETEGAKISISSATNGAEIRYTTDNSDPTPASGTLYNPLNPIPITGPVTIKAIAYKPATSFANSEISTGNFDMPIVDTPVISPAGGKVLATMPIHLTLPTPDPDVTIYYTTNGDTPDNTSTAYTGSFTLASSATVKAIAYKTAFYRPSTVASGSFTIVSIQLLKDIDQTVTRSSSPNNLAYMNNKVYYAADDGANGYELWMSDGTPAGTVMVKDINPGMDSSNPTSLTVVNNTLYFSATDGTYGYELWKSDGTVANAVMVRNIYVESAGETNRSSNPTYLVDVAGTLFFSASNGSNGYELWKSDGTFANTVLVKDINSPGSSNPKYLVNVGGTLYFSAFDRTNGTELWMSNGTNAGTLMVKDVYPGTTDTTPNSSNPKYLVNVGGTLYFSATDSTNGTEIWKSDGTDAGTLLAKDVYTGSIDSIPNSSNPKYLVNVGGTLFFTATTDGAYNFEIWKMDVGTETASLVKDICSDCTPPLEPEPNYLTDVNGTLYFSAFDRTNGNELWKSNGTTVGTAIVEDIYSGITSSDPSSLVNANGILYFAAKTAANGAELWKSTDGMPAGTDIVTDMTLASSSIKNLTKMGTALYFRADDGVNGAELWKSSGTTAGTVLLKDINTAAGLSSNPSELFDFDGTLFFNAFDNAQTELWSSTGSAGGTQLFKNLSAGGSSSPALFTWLNATTILFRATDETNGTELWKSDGTSGGTVLVKDINTAAPSATTGNSNPKNFAAINGIMYFCANDGNNGEELWKSDGTAGGTSMVEDIWIGSAGSSTPANLINLSGTLYFSARTGADGVELWKSDGTSEGTEMVKDINTGSGGSYPSEFNILNGKMYFRATSALGTELWMSDGTTEGTVIVKDINANAASSFPTGMTLINGKLYFTANDGINGNELWTSDGTAAGTNLLIDIRPGSASSTPLFFTQLDNCIYFQANDGINGAELWVTDGTAAGTVFSGVNLYAGTMPDMSSSPADLLEVNGMIFFTAAGDVEGRELFVIK